MLFAVTPGLFAQTPTAPTPSYKEMIVDNPNAEADLKVVSDYIKQTAAGDIAKAKSLLADTYMEYGPGSKDSADVAKVVSDWENSYKVTSNRSIGFVQQTFRVTSGPQKGDWVSVWGTYAFTQNGKSVSFPLQITALVANGKIQRTIVYFNELDIITQLGYTITPPAQD